MPRLSLRVTSHSSPSCGIALSLFSSQFAGCAHCIYCHRPSFPSLPAVWSAHLHTNTHTHRNIWAASSSLWLTSCDPPSLTAPLFFRRFEWPLSHTCRKVCESLPFPSFDDLTIWWISARLRQSVRHGRIRYKLSLLQGTASHHRSVSPAFICLSQIIPTSFLSHLLHFFFQRFSQFSPQVRTQHHFTIFRCCHCYLFEDPRIFCKCWVAIVDWMPRLWVYIQVYLSDANRYVSLSLMPPHCGTLCRE